MNDEFGSVLKPQLDEVADSTTVGADAWQQNVARLRKLARHGKPSARTWLMPTLVAAAVLLVVGTLAGLTIAYRSSSEAITSARATQQSLDPAVACRTPHAKVAHMTYVGNGNQLSTNTLYLADNGGQTFLCHGTTAGGPPASAVQAPAPGAITYLQLQVNAQTGLVSIWGAVRQDVSKLSITVGKERFSSTFQGVAVDDTGAFQDLGDDFKSFNTADQQMPDDGQPLSISAVAFNATGRQIDTRVVTSH